MSKKRHREGSQFGLMLRTLRKKRRITMKHLADQLGISESYISRLENGERFPDKDLILQLAPILFPEGNPTEVDALLISADFTPLQLDSKTGKDDLIQHFQQVLEQEPQNFRALNALIISLIKQQKFDVATQKIEMAMQGFDDSIQLQVLMGALELAKKDYDQAIQYQLNALQSFDANPKAASKLFLSRSDLLLNLAVIYFLKGYQQVDNYLQSTVREDFQLARQSLVLANQALNQALELDPDDIYALDEHARVLFNLAYLDETAGQSVSFAAVVAAFEKIIFSDDKIKLNYSELIESSLFLVHAYAKNQDFDLAERHIHLIESCLPNYWLVHYIKACLYHRKYEHGNQEAILLKALRSLERAIAIPDVQNRSKQEALYDPDLAKLRERYPEQIKSLLEGP